MNGNDAFQLSHDLIDAKLLIIVAYALVTQALKKYKYVTRLLIFRLINIIEGKHSSVWLALV